MFFIFKTRRPNPVAIMRALIRGERVDHGTALSVGPIWRNGAPSNQFGVWHHINGPERAPGALELATADPLHAAELFVRIRDRVTA